MRDDDILNVLEETAQRLGIKVDYDDLRKGEVNTEGGIFSLRGEKRILIHKGLDAKDRIEVLLKILSGMDTEGVHLPPAVRKRLDEAKTPQ